MRHVVVLLSALLLALGSVAPAWGSGSADRETSDVFDFADEQPIEGAVAELTRTDTGVGYSLRTAGLVEGHAVSIWWVIFNNPEECATGPAEPCEIDDLFNPDVAASVQSGGGHAVGASGKAGFAGHLNEGQVTTSHPLHEAFDLENPGLLNPRGAEIHLVVRSHGPLQPELNHEMFNSFEAGCVEFLDAGVMPEEEGECADLQFAVFK